MRLPRWVPESIDRELWLLVFPWLGFVLREDEEERIE